MNLFKSLQQFSNLITGFKIGIASPYIIAKWSWRKIGNTIFSGKISEPFTINYRTKLPELNGLFCEKIFGPIFSWQCKCGLLNIYYKPILCKICGTENNNCLLRRFRLGSLYLNTPIVHSWFIDKFLSAFLKIPSYILETLCLYDIFFKKIEYLNQKKISYLKKFTLTQALFFSNYLQKILIKINLLEQILVTRNLLNNQNIPAYKNFINKKLLYLNLFISTFSHPSWILIDILPIIPAGLRPFLKIENKYFTTTPINELYKNIILKNNRLRRWKILRRSVPIIFELFEKRGLQQSINLLINYNKKNDLKIFAFQGKYGRFRQYILGKRVDFSARSVIIPGPDLQISKVGLPANLSIELFKPILLKFLKINLHLRTFFKISLFTGHKLIILQLILKILLKKESLLINRAPTLHKMNIQTFKPHLIQSEAIKLFPLACSSFNADFDGDQMGIFIPLSPTTIKETKKLSALDKNIFSPTMNKIMIKFSQNIVLGLNSLLILNGNNLKNSIFSNIDNSIKIFNHNLISNSAVIIIRIKENNKKKFIVSSIGRLILQNI